MLVFANHRRWPRMWIGRTQTVLSLMTANLVGSAKTIALTVCVRPLASNRPCLDEGSGPRDSEICLWLAYLDSSNQAYLSLRNLARAPEYMLSKSIRVRKSIVLKARSIAGGPQIRAPIERYARR